MAPMARSQRTAVHTATKAPPPKERLSRKDSPSGWPKTVKTVATPPRTMATTMSKRARRRFFRYLRSRS